MLELAHGILSIIGPLQSKRFLWAPAGKLYNEMTISKNRLLSDR